MCSVSPAHRMHFSRNYSTRRPCIQVRWHERLLAISRRWLFSSVYRYPSRPRLAPAAHCYSEGCLRGRRRDANPERNSHGGIWKDLRVAPIEGHEIRVVSARGKPPPLGAHASRWCVQEESYGFCDANIAFALAFAKSYLASA